MRFTKRAISILVLVIILGVFFFPKNISTCSGDRLCFGWVNTKIEKNTWLNVKDSVLEIRDEEIKSCMGISVWTIRASDMCPGSWGWTNAAPIKYVYDPKRCEDPDQLNQGIRCSEWQRAFDEIKNKDSVHINIENITETGIYLPE